MTLNELAKWYVGTEDQDYKNAHPRIRKLASAAQLRSRIKMFNKTFGDYYIHTLRTIHLEEHQQDMLSNRMAPRTVDYQLCVMQIMLERARKAGKVTAEAVTVFQDTDRLLRKGDNARSKTLTVEE